MTDVPVPPPARAVELMGQRHGRETFHTYQSATWPIYGRVTLWSTWMIVQEYQVELQPELGVQWTFLVAPRQPIRCVAATAYRAAMHTGAVLNTAAEEQVYSDTVDLSPELAWMLADHPTPHLIYQSLLHGDWK